MLNSQISSQRDNTDDKYFFTGVVYQEMFLRLAMWQNQYFRAIEERKIYAAGMELRNKNRNIDKKKTLLEPVCE